MIVLRRRREERWRGETAALLPPNALAKCAQDATAAVATATARASFVTPADEDMMDKRK
jgi:hypothetical protein